MQRWKVICAVLVGILIIEAVVVLRAQYTSVDNQSLVIGFAGDTMLGRGVNELLMALPPTIRYVYPWGNLLPQLKKNDFNIVNLETTLTNSTYKVPKVFNFKANPDLVHALIEANISAVTIANNHILDFANEGLYETLKTLDDSGIQHVGAGINIAQARKPIILTKKGIRIGIIGYTDNEPDWRAGLDHPGTNYIKIGNINEVRSDIELVRKLVDVLVLTIHWGPNKIERPTQEFIDFAHQIIDAGVDIIHGHSAHLIQGIEIYKNKLILHNCGDFIDDYAMYDDARNDLGFLFLVTIDKNGAKTVQLLPTRIANCQVNNARGDDEHYIMKHMKLLCEQFGTYIGINNTIYIR